MVRDGEIIGVRHADGTPPYVVRWEDTGHESLVYPGPDAMVQHLTHDSTPESGTSRMSTAPSGHAPSPRRA
jgi:hypothetical protein